MSEIIRENAATIKFVMNLIAGILVGWLILGLSLVKPYRDFIVGEFVWAVFLLWLVVTWSLIGIVKKWGESDAK